MKTMDATVAILMGTYNGEEYIETQLLSILSQSYTNWKLFINDDGSTDNTIKIIKKIFVNMEDKVFISSNTSGGHGSTKNYVDLLNKIHGFDLYALCDQDDCWPNDRLDQMVNKFKKNYDLEPVLVAGNAAIVNKELKPSGETLRGNSGNIKGDTLNKEVFLLSTADMYGCVLMFNNSLKLGMGTVPYNILWHDQWIAMYAAYFGKVISMDKIVTFYRQHDRNVSCGKRNMLLDVFLRLKNGKGIVGRIKKIKNGEIEQMRLFLSSYSFLPSDKKYIEKLLQDLCSPDIVKRIRGGIVEKQIFHKGCSLYNICLFLVK